MKKYVAYSVYKKQIHNIRVHVYVESQKGIQKKIRLLNVNLADAKDVLVVIEINDDF